MSWHRVQNSLGTVSGNTSHGKRPHVLCSDALSQWLGALPGQAACAVPRQVLGGWYAKQGSACTFSHQLTGSKPARYFC